MTSIMAWDRLTGTSAIMVYDLHFGVLDAFGIVMMSASIGMDFNQGEND